MSKFHDDITICGEASIETLENFKVKIPLKDLIKAKSLLDEFIGTFPGEFTNEELEFLDRFMEY